MGEVIQIPTLKGLQDQVTMLNAVVAHLLGVLKSKDLMDNFDIQEVAIGAQWAVRNLDPRLGQSPTYDNLASIACGYATAYLDSGNQAQVVEAINASDRASEARAARES